MKDTVDGINEAAWSRAMTGERMNYPSIKSLMKIKGVTREDAIEIRKIMAGPGRDNGLTRMERIDKILRTCGVERIPCGKGANSPAFLYCNAGGTYDLTIVKRRGRFMVTTWGDLVERGRYE